MPRIPDDLVDRVKRLISIVTLVTRLGIELRKVGQNLVGRCNRHADQTASLMVGEEKNLFHCMGACQKGGSVIDWVMWQEDLGFHQATMKLIEEFFPEEARALAQARPSRRFRAEPLSCPLDPEASDAELTDQVVTYYQECGREAPEFRAYLEKRAVWDGDLVSRFRLGLSNRTLGVHLRGKLRRRVSELGFFREKTGHELLNGSLTIPILDEEGQVVGCYGRKITPNLRPGTPKHLYLPGPHRKIFNTPALTLFKEIHLCEAPIDMVSAVKGGFENTVSCFGSEGFNDEHVELFTRHGIRKVLIAFDRDEAGDSGARKVAERLLPRGIDCYRVLLPKGMDVNDVVRTMHPARKTLDHFFRCAEWMGNGRRPAHAAIVIDRARDVVVSEEAANSSSSAAPASPAPDVATSPATRPEGATEKEIEPAAEEETSVAASAPPPSRVTAANTPGLVKLLDDEAELLFDDRRYRVRGLKKCLAFGSLRLVVKVEREGVDFSPPCPISGWHMDTLDLCSHRARAAFEREAAKELGVKEEIVRFDLGKIVRVLESVQEERIAEASAPKTKAVTLSQKEIDDATDFLKSANLLERIVSDLTTCGLVGEDTNKLVLFVAFVSRLLARPLGVIIQSSSAAGKTSLMEAVLSLMPEESREKYTAVSGKSLFYFDESVSLKHKILAIVEEEGAERATYPLKILQSEGELVMASTGKDPHTGKLATHIYRVEGPVMNVLSTTANELDPELENRCLVLSVDEGREQTRRIHELQRHRQTVEGLVAEKEKERIRKLHRNAQRLLRPLHVLNPFEKELTFVDEKTRTRRDHDKYLTLIEAIALLHQFQRPTRRVIAGDESLECIEVALSDIAVANRLASEVLGRTLDELPHQTRKLLMLLEEMVKKESERLRVERSDFRFTRRHVRRFSGWGHTQLCLHLDRLVSMEYLLAHRGSRGQSFVYELLYAGEGKEGRRFVLGLVDVTKLGGDTTESFRGEEGEFPGSFRGQNGPIPGPFRADETSTSINASTAFPLSAAESPENARPKAVRKTRSYAPRLNLLRFPPGSLALRRRVAAR